MHKICAWFEFIDWRTNKLITLSNVYYKCLPTLQTKWGEIRLNTKSFLFFFDFEKEREKNHKQPRRCIKSRFFFLKKKAARCSGCRWLLKISRLAVDEIFKGIWEFKSSFFSFSYLVFNVLSIRFGQIDPGFSI